MDNIQILWADDEIDLLKPHIIFLEQKGYSVQTATSGDEALEFLISKTFDIIFLDENMPGLSGIETLIKIKDNHPNIPVIMITKSEEESIMEEAIGSKISDYLIKPVNPNQILLCLKKNLENKKLVSEKTTHAYQQEFRNIGMEIGNHLNYKEWVDIYKKIIKWEIELELSNDEGLREILKMQKDEANQVFSKFIEKRYIDWLNLTSGERPVLSHTLVREKILPHVTDNTTTFVILIDNLRYDQWKVIQPIIEEYFHVESDEIFFSILPTTTQYSRNAIFSGLMPTEIEKKYPKYWKYEQEEGTKNQYENELLTEQLKRFGKDIKHSYTKILTLSVGKRLLENIHNLMQNQLNFIVYNFVDMLSHARTEMEIIRELADDDPAYRSLTLSWFEHSSLLEIIKFIASKKAKLIITSDHGSIRVNNPVRIVGDKNTNTNLRYKCGRNLNFNKKDVFDVRDPKKAYLPQTNVSTSFVFCKKNDFFAYPNNFNYYSNYYKNTFQHGGVSMEELMIPIISLKAK